MGLVLKLILKFKDTKYSTNSKIADYQSYMKNRVNFGIGNCQKPIHSFAGL